MWKLLVGSGLNQVPVETSREEGRALDSRVGHSCQQPSPCLCLCWNSMPLLRAHVNYCLGICPLMTHKETSGFGESIYHQPLELPIGANGPPQFLRPPCLTAIWLWVVMLLIMTIWRTGRLKNSWGYNHWSVSEMHDFLVEKTQLQLDLHCVLSWKNKLALQPVS